jgi:MFS family permease
MGRSAENITETVLVTIRDATRESLTAAMPFLIVAAIAIVSAGVLAAAIAHAPTQPWVWLVAYLVLVVGVAQALLGATQAWLTEPAPSRPLRAIEFALFNIGNVGVMAGTLCASWPTVLAGTLLFAASLALFLYSTRRARRGWPLHVYRLLLTSLIVGATIGLVLSAARHLP